MKTIYVGIDYGTTYSGSYTLRRLYNTLLTGEGIAHVLSTDQNGKDIEPVTSWPGQDHPNALAEKVPSKIAYLRSNAPKDKAQGKKEVLWGYEVKPSGLYDIYSWTKLLLDTPD